MVSLPFDIARPFCNERLHDEWKENSSASKAFEAGVNGRHDMLSPARGGQIDSQASFVPAGAPSLPPYDPALKGWAIVSV
jgi:hypothetical protein